MGIKLGANRYGKAETRVVVVRRHPDRHEIKDLNVSVALSGDMADAHIFGDNSKVLPTDTQKNTVFAFARQHGVGEIEEFAIILARHFVDSQPSVQHARIAVDEYTWDRISLPGNGVAHSFSRSGTAAVRTAVVHYDAANTHVVSGIKDLLVLNSTGSEFWGFLTDELTTLKETNDRILSTVVTAGWRHTDTTADPHRTDWASSFREASRHLLAAFADTHSYSLQQTLFAMGTRVLDHRPELCEVRLELPNKHHFVVDLSPFGLDNANEVFIAADRPYGLMEGSVLRDDAPDAGPAWS
ncbi:MAG TPA: urate oxidase [Candidatus Limnocylindrales bacterium]|nr:urate oxidase [Candidatus Limnocylindrales bacterium]